MNELINAKWHVFMIIIVVVVLIKYLLCWFVINPVE